MRGSIRVFVLASLFVNACKGTSGNDGARGPSGVDGASVVNVSLSPGHGVCVYGGSEFTTSNGATYACNGAPGQPGVSVTAVALSPGADPACPAGGSRFTMNGTVTYACNAAGTDGPCSAGQALCGVSCRDLASDPANCGACGKACDSRICTGGLCAKVVFVTTEAFSGDLGGVTGANAKCQAAATNAGLSGTYFAWLSDSLGHSPAFTFSRSQAPYVLPNGAVVAANWSALLSTSSTSLVNAIGLDARGGTPPAGPWTGTNASGLPAGNNCSNWTSTAGGGATGYWPSTDAGWTYAVSGVSCNGGGPLYCFEQ
jgi:hypothetical protein